MDKAEDEEPVWGLATKLLVYVRGKKLDVANAAIKVLLVLDRELTRVLSLLLNSGYGAEMA
jgi:hypothetical protein